MHYQMDLALFLYLGVRTKKRCYKTNMYDLVLFIMPSEPLDLKVAFICPKRVSLTSCASCWQCASIALSLSRSLVFLQFLYCSFVRVKSLFIKIIALSKLETLA